MIYVTIDTCILKTLVSKIEYDGNLHWLKHAVDTGLFTLLVPENLKLEWEKHRQLELKQIDSALRVHVGSKKLTTLFSGTRSYQVPDSARAKSILNSQVDDIDKLLEEGIQVTPSKEVKLTVLEHQEKRYAPFIVKKDSNNDAYIIFSSLDFVKNKNDTLHFLSSNHTDFGAKEKGTDVLHSDITKVFPDVRYRYFLSFKSFRDGITPFQPSDDVSVDASEKEKFGFDSSKSTLEQIFNFLHRRFSEVKFLPLELFKNYPPFISNPTKPNYQLAFDLNTDNGEVIQALESDPELDETSQKKLEQIEHILFNNLVRTVSTRMQKRLEISTTADEPGITQSNYLTFNFEPVVNALLSEQGDPDELGLLAGNMGLFSLSLKYFGKNIDDVESANPTAAFFNWFNIDLLKKIIQNQPWEKGSQFQIPEQFLSFEISEKRLICERPQNKDILDYLEGRAFIRNCHAAMLRELDGIRDDFHSQSNGSNDHFPQLLFAFAQTEQFLIRNFILYTPFSEFQDVADLLVEGLLASVACSFGMRGKVQHFENYVISKVLHYSKPVVLKKYIKRYITSSIPYERPKENDFDFLSLAKNIFTSGPKATKLLEQKMAGSSAYFSFAIEKIQSNCILLASILDLDQTELEDFCLLLANHARLLRDRNIYSLARDIEFFIQKRHVELTDDQLIRFFKMTIYNPLYHDDVLTPILAHHLFHRNRVVNFDNEDIETLAKAFTGFCPSCNKPHDLDVTGSILSILDDSEQKKILIGKVSEHLEKEFIPSHYVSAILYDLIDTPEEFSDQYLKTIRELLQKGKRPTLAMKDNMYFDNKLDEYLNVSFKTGIPVPDDIKIALSSLDPYYCWILDPDLFDYRGFHPDWVHHNFTKAYKNYFRKSSVLKRHLSLLLRTNFDEYLAKFFFHTYEVT